MDKQQEVNRLNALSQEISTKQSEAMLRFSASIQAFNETDRKLKDLLLAMNPEEQ